MTGETQPGKSQPVVAESLAVPVPGESVSTLTLEPLFPPDPLEQEPLADTTPDQAPDTQTIVYSQAVLDALTQIQDGDVLDAYLRRINGTSALASKATFTVGAPTALLTTASEGVGFGLPTAVITGTTLLAAGLLPPAVTYARQRIREPRKVAERATHQEVIRNHLGGEDVDIIRQKGRKKRGLHVRWYGADAPNGAPEGADAQTEGEKKDSNAALLDRFAGITQFALDHDGAIKSLVVSADLLDKLPKGDSKTLREKYKDKLTTNDKFFAKAKGIKLHDRNADHEVLQLTPLEAQKLLEDNGHKGELPLQESLANYLAVLCPDHVAAQAIRDWKASDKNPVYKDRIISELRAKIERRLQSNTEPVVAREYVETSVRNPDGTFTEAIVPVNTTMDTTLMVGKNGVHYFDSASLVNGDVSQARIDSISRLVGEDVDNLAEELAKLAKQRADAPEDKKYEYDTAVEKLELVLYHQLLKGDHQQKKVPASHKGVDVKMASRDEPTFYERLPGERPRSFILPRVASRGKVSKADQTIEYGRKVWRNLGKKVGAVAVAGILAYGAGEGVSSAWAWSESREFTCDPEVKHEYKTPEEQADHDQYCTDNFLKDILTGLGSAGAEVFHASANYEDSVIEKLYTSGLLSPATIAELAGNVDAKWAAEKAKDLQGRYNLYSSSRAPTMNATLSESGDPTLWKLEPTGGAETKGYWPSSTQDSLYIDSLASDLFRTPPFAKGTLEFSQSISHLVPFGKNVDFQYASEVGYIRELALPATPRDTSDKLIKVTGRQAMNGKSMDVKFYNPQGITSLEGAYEKSWLVSDLPVIEGGDIVAGSVTQRALSTDKVVSQGLDLQNFFQQDDGTFHVRLPYGAQGEADNYVEVTYWVKPHSTTALPMSIKHPLTISQRGEYDKPLAEVLTPESVAELRRQLGVKPDATFEQIAKAIHDTRTYSFTPYPKDAPGDRAIELDKDPQIQIEVPTDEAAVDVASYAAQLKAANCAVARTIETIVSRGVQSDGTFINGVTGFRLKENAGALLQSQSHTYLRTDGTKGVNIDPTPDSTNAPGSQRGKPLDFKDSPQPHSDNFGNTIKAAVGGFAFGTGLPLGIKSFSYIAASGRRRRERQELERQRFLAEQRQAKYDAAINYLPGNEPKDGPLTPEEKVQRANDLNEDLAILNHVLHAPKDAVLDDAKLPHDDTSIVGTGSRSFEERLKDLPFNAKTGPWVIRDAIRRRIANGTLKVSDERIGRLDTIAAHAFAIQDYVKAQQEQERADAAQELQVTSRQMVGNLAIVTTYASI